MADYKQTKEQPKTRILYVHYGEDWIRGSEVVLLELLQSAKWQNYQPVLWCNSSVLAKKARSLGIEVIQDNFVCIGYWILPRWNIIQFFNLMLKAKKLIKQYKVKLVHCNNGAPCQWMTPICKITQTPMLLHLHARYMYRDRLTLLFHGADSIVGVSQSVIKAFKNDEFSRQDVSIIYNGINVNRIKTNKPLDLRAKLSAENSDFVILFVGSLIPRKRVDQLIYALSTLQGTYSIKLAIVGSGSEKAKLAQLSTTLGLDDHIQFFSDNDEVSTYYASNADCFISVPTEEVFGLTLAEASLAKLPIITSNIEGINEIYKHQENALLVTPNKMSELIDAIKVLIDSPDTRTNYADKAHNHITENFSCNKQFMQFHLAYQNLLTKKKYYRFFSTLAFEFSALFKAFMNKGYQYLMVKLAWGKHHD